MSDIGNRMKQSRRTAESSRLILSAKRIFEVLRYNSGATRNFSHGEKARPKTVDTGISGEAKSCLCANILRKALGVLHEIWSESGVLDEARYDALRKEKNDKSLIRLKIITSRFFDNDKVKLEEAVSNYNHRIKTVVSLSERFDVYDIEVPKTHNFALASGVFVHNSAKQGRDRRTQAILPLRGKVLNVERARLDKILAFAEIKALVIALGTGIAEGFDVSKLRYHKVIIATDADVDGAHIRTLLLTLFFRYFRALIDGGYIYIAQPPLYKVKRGKEFYYFYTDETRDAFLKKELKQRSLRRPARTKERSPRRPKWKLRKSTLNALR